ncbi:UNVERIFIED_CONTAM: hypothetical protein GTU68_016211 [Idotea baltica]|nr:hypothetical protein [Idotea baltica]
MSFNALGLSEALLKAVRKKGYSQPSPIQEKAIPHILQGKDILASAQTGTGKTAGFTLPMLHILSENPKEKFRPIRALILTPTRELAAQVYANVREYSEFTNLRSTVIFGGVNQKPQVSKIRQGVDILVATPGRLLDLESQNLLSLKRVEIFVLDEADRMLDMGFLRDIERVMKLMPDRRQNLMFSATFSKDNIAARGLDIPLLPHVVNFELPNISEDYVHRIGRTGRAGAQGEAISLVSADETSYLRDIEKLVGMKIPIEIVEGFEPDPNASTAPIKQGQGRNRNSNPRNSRNNKSNSKGGSKKPSGNKGRNRNSRRNRN